MVGGGSAAPASRAPDESTTVDGDRGGQAGTSLSISPKRVAVYVLIVLSTIALIGVALVIFTVTTEYSAHEVREWAAVGAAGLAGVGSVVAASVAIFAISAQQRSSEFAIAMQERAASVAVEAQLRTSRDALEHQRLLASETATAERERSTAEALRLAAAELTATLANIDLLASGLKRSADQDHRRTLEQLSSLQREARARYETLRLLGSRETQRAGRMALRHAWAMWRQAETGDDPRSDEYRGDPPWRRYHRELLALLISIRRDLGLPDPDDVFAEPDD
jgi:hypothetical protein